MFLTVQKITNDLTAFPGKRRFRLVDFSFGPLAFRSKRADGWLHARAQTVAAASFDCGNSAGQTQKVLEPMSVDAGCATTFPQPIHYPHALRHR